MKFDKLGECSCWVIDIAVIYAKVILKSHLIVQNTSI